MGTIADRPRIAPIQKTLKTENGSKVKRLSLSSTVHKFGGVGSGVPRKNRTLEPRRSARSIRDVAFADRRESVAEARPRYGLGGRLMCIQASVRHTQAIGPTTGRHF